MTRKRNKRAEEARAWLEAKLAEMHARLAAPLPEVPKPKPLRYQLSRDLQRPQVPSCPPDIPRWEWDAAALNVQRGSAPSLIKKGSDIPSDWTMRRNGFAS
jgi:hypothetical protein